LDAGCGTGCITRALEQAFPDARILALDAAPAMLARARGRCRRSEFHTGNLDEPLPFADGAVDRIVCSNVLYSLPRPDFTLGEFQRVLRPGGKLVLATPIAQFRLWELVRHHLRGGPAAWGLFCLVLPSLLLVVLCNALILSRARARVYHFFDRDELEGLLRGAGFQVERFGRTYADQDWLVVACSRSQPDR
ncbi:MAG: class I SAM-dependent methyltransferase, partial [Candidatus Eremiobacterota bacterium]